MGGTKLCLLLLLGSYTLAQQDVGNAEELPCYLAKRFKHLKRFVYDYQVETFNGVNTPTDNKSGPKISCNVEVEVPQTCSFVLRTTECSLSEISSVDRDGNLEYRPADGAEAFRSAMAKNLLKFTVEGLTDVKVFPEDDEPVNILNIKRGIVSTLIGPHLEEERNAMMATVHGICPTDFAVTTRKGIALDVTTSRDLSRCDSFYMHRQATSPLALITGMDLPLSMMISGTQTCSYSLDTQTKYMSSGVCTEKHVFQPLSQKTEFGIATEVKQTMSLRKTTKINDRVFECNEDNVKDLSMDVADDKSPVQTKDAALDILKEMNNLKQYMNKEQRSTLFYKLVSELRGLKADILRPAVAEMMAESTAVTWQALIQCGTPECTSAMLMNLRTFDGSGMEVDAAAYALQMMAEPSRLVARDILAMAQDKQSKPIMYALSNIATRLYQAESITPEITAISDFISSLLGADCAGEKELTFLTLRVLGNMGEAMEAADPAIKTTLVKCMRQPATTLSVQLAAIQAFRRMTVTDEVRANLQRVSQYSKGAVQKRLAAYLMLMKRPQDSDIEMVKKLLTQEQNDEVKSFVTSHVFNIISSTDAETQELGRKILDALQDTDVLMYNEDTAKSSNYKMGLSHENMGVDVQGSVIFDPSSQLPREVLLETTLKAFGFSMDIWEIGMQGKGFEPTINALFGKNGFFPDTLSKTLYWTVDKIPQLDGFMAPRQSQGRKIPENLWKEIVRNFNKLMKDLQSQESPEAMAYLRIKGEELGYMKGSEVKSVLENIMMFAEKFSMLVPRQIMAQLMSRTDNDIYAHYIFMDNRIVMPTASGLPLTFGLSGTFTPGAKGGFNISPKMKELVFKPSLEVEFVTQMGVHVPEFVASTVRIHTNMYHDSTFNAKITMDQNQVKLSIPNPKTIALFSISNKVQIMGTGKAISPARLLFDRSCNHLYPQVNYCYERSYSKAGDYSFFPMTGQARYSIRIQPSIHISEYTATVSYNLLSEGKDGRQKVDSLKLALKAEGSEPTEATVTMRYNRNRNIFTSHVQIPDFNVETGIKIGITDSNTKGKTVTLELSSNNIPQLSLIGRAKVQAIYDGMLQLQLLVPFLGSDAAITATMSKDDGLAMELRSDVKFGDTFSNQAVMIKYDEEEVEVQLVSKTNVDTTVLDPYAAVLHAWVMHATEYAMDQQVVNTDMKLRHIVSKAVEASSIWIEKIENGVPYVERLREIVNDVELPENLFMNLESSVKYSFNKNRATFSVPLPYGGRSSEELRIPRRITSPQISVPQLGMELTSNEIEIPTFTIPSEYDVTLPLMGMMEASAKVSSNYYNWKATVSVGNNTEDSLSYKAKFNMLADSPIQLLCFSTAGTMEMMDTEEDAMTFSIDTSLNHMLMKTSFSSVESLTFRDDVKATGKYNMYAFTPVGLETSLTATTQVVLDSTTLSGDVNTDGSLTVGAVTATTTSLHTFSVKAPKKEARLESTLRVNSEILKFGNTIKALCAKGTLLLDSNTYMNMDPIKHTTNTTLKYDRGELTMHAVSGTKADALMLYSIMNLNANGERVNLRIENQADDKVNRGSSVFFFSVNPTSLDINNEASLNIFSTIASNKATFSLNMNGITSSCTTTAKHGQMTFEKDFHGGIDASGAAMSLTTKGAIGENTAELKVDGKLAATQVYLNGLLKGDLFDINTINTVNLKLNEDGFNFGSSIVGSLNEMRTENINSLSLTLKSFTLHTKTDNFLNERNSYMHDVTVKMEDFTASAIIKHDMKIMAVNFVNNGHFKVEPYNMELAGTTIGRSSNEELRHIYEVKFVDMVLSAKCTTNGNLLGTELTHTTDMEVDGLAITFNSKATFKSLYLELEHKVKTVAAPYTLDINAIFKSDGEVYLYGRQSGNLYSKFLLKAEPLLITNSLECRASTTHELDDSSSIKTGLDSKLNTVLSLEEQSVVLKMSSKVDEHSIVQDMSAYNNEERIGIEMRTVASTPLFSDDSEDYEISGFVKYDKNSDSHFIQIPFLEHLPGVIENVMVTVARLMDHTIETLSDIDTKYEISATFHKKVSQLKEVIDNFDFNDFGRDLKNLLNPVEEFVAKLAAKFPTEELINMLRSVIDSIMAWLKRSGVSEMLTAISDKLEEILSSYEVENMIGAIMDEIVKLMKQFRVRERIQSIIATLRSIDIQPLVKKVMAPIQKVVNELHSFDLKLLIDGLNSYFMRIVQEIQSFDYETFTMELKDKVADMSKIPCFGKLYGELKVTSPHYNIRTTAGIENATTSLAVPEFKMNLVSRAESTLKILEFNVDASTHVVAPEMNPLSISENIKIEHSCFKLNHKGTMTLESQLAQGSADTTATVKTEMYTAELVGNALLVMDAEPSISVDATNKYKQTINMPMLDVFSETSMSTKTLFLLKDGTAHLTVNDLANGKYAVKDSSDEGNYQSDLEVVMDLHSAKVNYGNKIDSNNLKMKESVIVDICIFRHIIVDAKVETNSTVMMNSVAELKLQAKTEDLKIDFSASHITDFGGNNAVVLNSVALSVSPGEFVFDTKNQGNGRVALPFLLLGRFDLQNDISVTLNSEVQQASLTGRARFNRYKYSHLITMDNNDREITLNTQINGEAKLDFLKERIDVPELTWQLFGWRTRRFKYFSLWENTGMREVLITTLQTFDMSSKLKYAKNPEMITININMEPLISAINSNAKTVHKKMLIGKDKAVAMMTKSFDTAKAEYDKYSIEMPKTVTVPAYKVPVLNIEKSAFTIPLPDFSAVKMPRVHVPSALRKLSLPKITLPKTKTISIPVMGDLTSEFAMKTAMLTFKTDSSILNQDGFLIKFNASTTSVHKILNGNIEGNINVNTGDQYAMTSHLSAKYGLLEGKHDGAIVAGCENMSFSVINSAKHALYPRDVEVVQEMKGNPEEGLLFSMFSSSVGFLGLEMQTKQPAQAKARLYGRFLSEPKTDVDIVAVKMSVRNSESLNIQATWNMEIPNEVMLQMKKTGPQVAEIVILPAYIALDVIYHNARNIPDSFESAKEQSKQMLSSAFDHAAVLYSSDTVKSLTDSTIVILKQYKKKVEIIFDAVITFLRETRFQLPGYERKLSGLEVYQKVAAFIADFSEDVVQKVPMYLHAMFTEVLNYFSSLEFVIPGTDYIISRREILDDLLEAMKEIQYQVIATVRRLGDIRLEDIFEKLSEFMQFTLETSEKFLQTLKSVNLEEADAFVNNLFDDTSNSPFTRVLRQVEEVLKIITNYLRVVSRKLRDMLPRHQHLKSAIQPWIDSVVKRINSFHNDVVKTLKDKTEGFEPYLKVGDRQVEVNVPLPFVAE